MLRMLQFLGKGRPSLKGGLCCTYCSLFERVCGEDRPLESRFVGGRERGGDRPALGHTGRDVPAFYRSIRPNLQMYAYAYAAEDIKPVTGPRRDWETARATNFGEGCILST